MSQIGFRSPRVEDRAASTALAHNPQMPNPVSGNSVPNLTLRPLELQKLTQQRTELAWDAGVWKGYARALLVAK